MSGVWRISEEGLSIDEILEHRFVNLVGNRIEYLKERGNGNPTEQNIWDSLKELNPEFESDPMFRNFFSIAIGQLRFRENINIAYETMCKSPSMEMTMPLE